MTTEAPRGSTAAREAAGGGRLHRRALGVPDLVFFIVAASAPLTVVAGGTAVSYLVTGNAGTPLLYLVVGGVLALFTVGYAAMSHRIANAGAFYSYVAHGIGRVPAVGTAFVALVAYNAMQIGIYGLFGVAMGAFADAKLGIGLDWWAWCLIAWAIIGMLGFLRVDLNARVLAILLIAETLVVVIFDIAVLADPGPDGLSLDGFDPGISFGTAAGAAISFVMAAFVGFESSAIYSEEVKDPRRTVARATYIAIAGIALLYALSAWLLAASIGPQAIVDPNALVEGGFTTPDGAAPDPTVVLFAAGTERLGAFWGDAAALLFATSLFAALLSFHNAIARYLFALGREGVLPRAFGRTHPRTGAPYVGSVAQSILAVTVFGLFAILGKDPVLTLFTWFTNLGALGVLLLLTLASFGVVGFFRKHRQPGESAFTTSIAPILAGVLLTALFVVVLLNYNVLVTGATDAPLDEKTVIFPAILLVGGVIGLAVAASLRTSKPDVYARIGHGGEGDPQSGAVSEE
jgi:amino acid transporter